MAVARSLRTHTYLRAWTVLASIVSIVTLGAINACRSIDMDPAALAAVGFDTVLTPAIVAGDSMRDTFGVAIPLHGNAFNIQGDSITGFALRYRQLDTGVTVDSVTGYVIAGDSALATGVRVLVDANGLQSQSMTLYVVRRPDTLLSVDSSETFTYSLRDSSANNSPLLTVMPNNISGASLIPVPAWVVSFAIQHAPPAVTTTPGADTLVAQLVGSTGQPARSAIGDASSGVAGIRVRIRPRFLASLTDSVVVLATAKYRGVAINGSPKRLVLYIQAPSS